MSEGIGARLQKLLNERKCTPIQLAREIEVPEQTIYSLIKRDSKKVSIDVLLAICAHFNVPPEYFSAVDARPDRSGDQQEINRIVSIAMSEGFTVRELNMALEIVRTLRAFESAANNENN